MFGSRRVVARLGIAAIYTLVGVLISITLVFAVLRVMADLPHLAAGTAPDPNTIGANYVRAPWLAYLHIIPGVIYLVGAVLQLSSRFRDRHLRVHRALGRVILPLGLLSGVFALVFGGLFAFGGEWQSLSTVVFGSWFMVSLVMGYRAIRVLDLARHRRWMIRAFVIGLGVGTIRIWIALFGIFGVFTFQQAFAPAFWLGLSLHVLAGELWLLWRPRPDSRPPVRQFIVTS